MKPSSLWWATLPLFVLNACTPAPEQTAEPSQADLDALGVSTERFLAAWNAADVEALGAWMAEDAIEMPPDGPPLVGRAAMLQGLRDYFAEFDAVQTATTDEVVVRGDLAVLRGTWRLTETPRAGGPPVERSGKWLDVQRRTADGSWKTWRWMWNQTTAAEGT